MRKDLIEVKAGSEKTVEESETALGRNVKATMRGRHVMDRGRDGAVGMRAVVKTRGEMQG